MKTPFAAAIPEAILAALLLAGCVSAVRERARPPPGLVQSNIERKDYSGSQSCAPCHQRYYDAFMASPMHNMTRLPERAGLDTLFNGRVFRFKDDSVILETRGGKPCARILSHKFGNRIFLVTKAIGGHHREDFAGVEQGAKDTLTERILPVSWMVETRVLRYKGYSVMDPERPGLKPGAVWNKTCLFCHNTVPYLSVVLGDLAGPLAPPFQGGTVDRWLPADRRRPLITTDPEAMRRAITLEIDFLRRASGARGGPWSHAILSPMPGATASRRQGAIPEPMPGPVQATARKAMKLTWDRFNETHLLEIGIGCESCHGGSREHVLDPLVRPSLEPRSPYLRVSGPPLAAADEHSQAVTRACARCHQVLFTGYPWTWEGKARDDPQPGGAHINSGEARDLLLGNCRITCTACHDPHSSDHGARVKNAEGPAGNAVCTACHGGLADPLALRAHSHHDPLGAGGLCLNCHMPRKNMTLDTRLGRYHRIGSPADPVKVESDRPLECALCHGGKPVGELVDTLEGWWGHRYDRAKLTALYGDLRENAVAATLRNGKPHEKAVALYLAGTLDRGPAGNPVGKAAGHSANVPFDKRVIVPLAARELADPYPLVRYYAENALADMLGKPSPLDLHGDSDSLMRAAAAWLGSEGFRMGSRRMDSVKSNERLPPPGDSAFGD